MRQMEFLKNVIKLYRTSHPQVIRSDLSEVESRTKLWWLLGSQCPLRNELEVPEEVTALYLPPQIDTYGLLGDEQFQQKPIVLVQDSSLNWHYAPLCSQM